MTFTIQNGSEATHLALAKVYQADIDILVAGIQGTGASTGLTVSAQSPTAMAVDVASGTAIIGGSSISAACGTVSIPAAHATLNRLDLVYVDNAGSLLAASGTPAASPLVPDLPGSTAALAFVYVPATATEVTSAQVAPKQVLATLPISGAAASSQYLVLSADSGLLNERIFTPSAPLSGSDGGAGGAYELDVSVSSLTEQASPASNDWLLLENNGGGTLNKVQVDNVPAGVDPNHTHSKIVASDGDPDPALSADATGDLTIGTGLSLTYADGGATVDEFSTDGTLAGNSDTALPTEKGVKTYVDALGVAQDWTPTVDQGGAVSVTVTGAKYTIVGDKVTLIADVVATSAGTAANAVIVSGWPSAINPLAAWAGVPLGSGRVNVAGVGTYWGFAYFSSTAALRFIDSITQAQMGVNPNFALAIGDIIRFSLTYTM